jgi:hypothetical protein
MPSIAEEPIIGPTKTSSLNPYAPVFQPSSSARLYDPNLPSHWTDYHNHADFCNCFPLPNIKKWGYQNLSGLPNFNRPYEPRDAHQCDGDIARQHTAVKITIVNTPESVEVVEADLLSEKDRFLSASSQSSQSEKSESSSQIISEGNSSSELESGLETGSDEWSSEEGCTWSGVDSSSISGDSLDSASPTHYTIGVVRKRTRARSTATSTESEEIQNPPNSPDMLDVLSQGFPPQFPEGGNSPVV